MLALTVALLTAACGSTALVDGGQLPAGTQDAATGMEEQQGLAVSPTDTTTDTTDTTAAAPTTSSPGGQTTQPTGGSAPATDAGQPAQQPASDDSTGSDQSRPAARTAAGTYGPGVTDDEIVIGIALADDASQAQNAALLGASNITQGDTERYYEIMAEHINENGGIAGRDLRYSKWRFSTAEGENYSQLEQSACEHWTQDDPALLAAGVFDGENFLGCAKDAGLGTWSSGLTQADNRTLGTYPTHMLMSAVSLTRQGQMLADGLEAQDYFEVDDPLATEYKLGVVTFDGATWKRAVNESLEPALAAHGRRIDEKAFLRELQSNSQLGDLTAQIQSTVLRFKSEGVTHVTFVDHKGVITLLFTRSAENQNYRPRYGMTSQSGGTVIANSGVPEGQFDGAVGVGWLPALDVPPSEMPANPAADECLERFAEKGEEPANANNKGVMLGICEGIFFAKASLEAGLPDLTAASFRAGVESLGDYPSLNSFQNHFAPTRHDGASHYSHMAYERDCNCFHYTSNPIADQS